MGTGALSTACKDKEGRGIRSLPLALLDGTRSMEFWQFDPPLATEASPGHGKELANPVGSNSSTTPGLPDWVTQTGEGRQVKEKREAMLMQTGELGVTAPKTCSPC